MIIDFDMANINKSNVPKWKWNDIQNYTIAFNKDTNSLSFVLPYYLDLINGNPLSIPSNPDCKTIDECCKKYNIACDCKNRKDCCEKYGLFCFPCQTPKECCEKNGGKYCDCETAEECCKKYGLFCDCETPDECCKKYSSFCDCKDADDCCKKYGLFCNPDPNKCKKYDYISNVISRISNIPSNMGYRKPTFCADAYGCVDKLSKRYSSVNGLVPEKFSKALDCCEKSGLGVDCGFICGKFDKIEVRGSSLISDGWHTPDEIIDKMCSECTKKHILQKIIKEEDSDYFYFYLVNYDMYTNKECKRELIKKIPKKEDECVDKYFLQKIGERTIDIKKECKTKIEGKIEFNDSDDYINYKIFIFVNRKKVCEFDLTDIDTYVSFSGDNDNISFVVHQVERHLTEVSENDDYDLFLEIYNYETGEDEKHYYKVEKNYNEFQCGSFKPQIGSNLIEIFYLNEKCIKVKKYVKKR